MKLKQNHIKTQEEDNTYISTQTVPFDSAEQAWFWFIQAQSARLDGARYTSGEALIPRPCEPVDILKILERLYRNRRLLRDHLLILRHYGNRKIPPDRHRIKEARAHMLWNEALKILTPSFERKGIIRSVQTPQAWMETEKTIVRTYR